MRRSDAGPSGAVMKYALFLITIVLAIGVIGIILYRSRPRNEEFGGFRDWVKNPDWKKSASDYFDARESLTVPDDISDAEIRRMVDRLFVQKDEDSNFERLKLVGAKAVPFLTKALENSAATTLFRERSHVFDAQSPFERICDLLEPLGPPEAALPLAKYLNHDNDHFRKHAAIALGNIGTAECIEPMLKALDDDNDYVRSYAMMGIQRGIEAKRCTHDFLDAMFPALTKLLNRDDSSVGGEAPKLLLDIDTGRALPVLLSPDYFTIENREVHYIIRALNASGHKIPHDKLLPFLKEVKPLIDKYPHHYEYADALIAYAHHPDAAAEQTFRAEVASANEEVGEAAAEALAILSGVTNARGVVFGALKDGGFDALSSPQKHYYAVFIYDAEVTNGGHSQYFVNSSGDHWKAAMEGLKAIGDMARAKVLHDAVVLFGVDGPSEENDARHLQLARFSSRQDKRLEELDSTYYSCKESIEVLLAQYALLHKEHFVTTK
jgi:HEAT repeat protein